MGVQFHRSHKGGPWTEGPAAPTPAAPALPEPPARSATKAAWVAYAEALGVDSSGTRADIIARVAEQDIDAGDRGTHIGTPPLGDEQITQGAELGDGAAPGDGLEDDPADQLGHED